MSRPPDVRALSFDCYGTLIDWRGGIRAAARDLASLALADLDRLLIGRERHDAELVRGPYRPYRMILAESLALAAHEQALEPSREELATFANAMTQWPPFPDAPLGLARLRSRFRLAIASNVESEVLEASVRELGVHFDACVTADQVGSYKPARAHFDELLRRLDLEPRQVLHCSAARYYDLAPARELGLRTAWIARQDETWPKGEAPDVTVRDLEELATVLA